MPKILRIPRKLALSTAGFAVLSIGMLIAVIPARAGNQVFSATINGPATVLDDFRCTWTATTDIPDPVYEWSKSNPETTIIGNGPSVSHAFDYDDGGPHQGLHLRVSNAAGALAGDDKLIGVFAQGSPECGP